MKRNSLQLTAFTLSFMLFGTAAQAYVYASDDKNANYHQKKIAKLEAQQENSVLTPEFEGGLTASIGTFYVMTSADNQAYAQQFNDSADPDDGFTTMNVEPDYAFGFDASLGYIFPETANAVELYYRTVSSDGSDSAENVAGSGSDLDADGTINYDLNAFDLMFSQFMDIGRYMQMRFSGGIAYAELDQKLEADRYNNDDASDNIHNQNHSTFTGWGPRIGIDTRYDFGMGVGIVGGGSMAYYLGKLKATSDADGTSLEDNHDNHNTTNLRANLGVDFVYFVNDEERSTIGLELGYLVDYYADGVGTVNTSNGNTALDTFAVTFSGPYLNLKGVF